MGSGFFRNMVPDAAHWVTAGLIPGPGGPGRMQGVNGGPYAGVAPTLAGANAGYGGAVQPGANPMATATPINNYRASTVTTAGT
jgi:hypothetical protein